MNQNHEPFESRQQRPSVFSAQLLIGLLLLVALLAFELFNFDTTKYALTDFLGDTQFAGMRWATILAVAFCAIDFAGLIRFFTPERGRQTPAEVWYLMGAWMLAATLNALMTWWAVTLTLLNHELGNEIMSREELLRYVPLFVASLVWLTRLLFIGAFSVAGGYLFDYHRLPIQLARHHSPPRVQPARRSRRTRPGDKPDSFAFERPSLPHQVHHRPISIYARGQKK